MPPWPMPWISSLASATLVELLSMRPNSWPSTRIIRGKPRYSTIWWPAPGPSFAPANMHPRRKTGTTEVGFDSRRLLLAAVVDLQVVGYREHARNGIGPNAGGVLVGLSAHHSFERHVSVVHDDVNRRDRPGRIDLQAGEPVNSPVFRETGLIVKRCSRQNLNLVVDRLNAFDAL